MRGLREQTWQRAMREEDEEEGADADGAWVEVVVVDGLESGDGRSLSSFRDRWSPRW